MTLPQDQPIRSPAQAFYEILCRAGYVSTKRDFARLLRMNESNVYAYLFPVEPRDDDLRDQEVGRRSTRIRATTELLQSWAFVIAQATELRIDVVLSHTGDLFLEVSGKDAFGRAESFRCPTLYASYDFRPPTRWEEEWKQSRMAKEPVA